MYLFHFARSGKRCSNSSLFANDVSLHFLEWLELVTAIFYHFGSSFDTIPSKSANAYPLVDSKDMSAKELLNP